MNFESLFTSFKINQLELPNRIVMAPMTRSMSPNNIPDNNVLEYYKNRAMGGLGLIITEGGYISPMAGGQAEYDGSRIPAFYTAPALFQWEKIAKAVHKNGTKIFAQLWHVGSMRVSELSLVPDQATLAPSAILHPNSQHNVIPQAMQQSDIDKLIQDFVISARNLQNIGFDGVELHGAHGYLLDQFFWDKTNERNDKYGGSIANRAQIAAEIVRAIKCELGANFPVILRISQWKIGSYQAKLANSPLELKQFLNPIVNAGIDGFHCSTRNFYVSEFDGSSLSLAGWVKQITNLPTITVGGVGSASNFIDTYLGQDQDPSFKLHYNLQLLLDKFNLGEFDLIAIGRALIADPEWPNKIKNGDLKNIISFDKKMLAIYP